MLDFVGWEVLKEGESENKGKAPVSLIVQHRSQPGWNETQKSNDLQLPFPPAWFTAGVVGRT